jgi:hypothetical protein
MVVNIIQTLSTDGHGKQYKTVLGCTDMGRDLKGCRESYQH